MPVVVGPSVWSALESRIASIEMRRWRLSIGEAERFERGARGQMPFQLQPYVHYRFHCFRVRCGTGRTRKLWPALPRLLQGSSKDFQ